MTIFEQPPPPPLSLHIPRIDTRNLGPRHRDLDFVRQFVAKQFRQNHVGTVHHVDLLSKTNRQGYLYYEAFVHFTTWCDSAFSLELRRNACSPRRRAQMYLPGTRHYWVINENKKPPLVEDFQSILVAIPVALWQQAADETEAWEHWRAQQVSDTLDRWYKNPPTDDQLTAVGRIEHWWSRRTAKHPSPTRVYTAWKCDTCDRPEVPGDPSTEAYDGNTCERCVGESRWGC